MSSAAASVAAAPPPAAAAPPGVAPPTSTAGNDDTTRSFKDLLTEQRAGSTPGPPDVHGVDARPGSDGKGDPSLHGKTPPTKGSHPRRTPDPAPDPATEPLAQPDAGTSPVRAPAAIPATDAANGPSTPSTAPSTSVIVADVASPMTDAAEPTDRTEPPPGDGAPSPRAAAGTPGIHGAEVGSVEATTETMASPPAPPAPPAAAAAFGRGPARASSAGGSDGRVVRPAVVAGTPDTTAGTVGSAPVDPSSATTLQAPSRPLVTPDSLLAAHPVGAVSRPEGTTPSTDSSVTAQAAGALDVQGLSGSISRPLSGGNGNYTVTVALHPPELGHLQAVLSLQGNDLQVSMVAQSQRGHEALASSLDALKNQLSRGGVNVSVTLRDRDASSGGNDERRQPAPPAGRPVFAGDVTAVSSSTSSSASGQIHLVL